MRRGRPRHRFTQVVVVAFCTFIFLFPKGGIRLLGIPETWGYLLIALSFPLLIPVRLLAQRVRFLRRQLVALLLLVPFWLVFVFAWLRNGTDGSIGRGGAISTAVGFIFLPIAFLWIYPGFLENVDGAVLARWLRRTVLAAALFGIFQFAWRPVMGYFIQVPYLTVNAGDASDFEDYKMIARGSFFKLISTYNNGNVYGAATLAVLPLFDAVTKRRWQRITLRAALFLTLSRTVWAGLIFEQLLSLGAIAARQVQSFPILRVREARTKLLLIVGALPIFLFLVLIIGYNPQAFLLDQSLGGRSSQLMSITSATILPAVPLTFFSEIIYLSALNMLGVTGLIGMVLIFGGPLLVLAVDTRALRDPFRRAALKGLLLYALIACSDGAINFIPVLAFYWFSYMIFVFGFPKPFSAYTSAVPVHTSSSSSPSLVLTEA